MICTNIEQSQQLVRLGLDPVTADMCFEMEKGNWTINVGKKSAQVNRGLAIPAWSLSALLEVMPKDTNETYHLFSSMMPDQLGSWVCDRSKYYMDADGYNKNDYECFKSNSPVTAAYEMVCWLLEQGLIEKG